MLLSVARLKGEAKTLQADLPSNPAQGSNRWAIVNAIELLTVIAQLFFSLLCAATLIDFAQRRDNTRRDIALVFGSLGFASMISLVSKILGLRLVWLSTLGSLALIAQPYLLLRIVRYFRPLPVTITRAALVGIVVLCGAILVFGSTVPGIVTFAAVVYFAGIEGYAMVAFIRGALTTSGVVQRRLRFAAAGSGLLGLALIMAGTGVFVPAFASLTTALVLAAGIGCALAFYLGFAPPRWLRRAWQLTELDSFLTRLGRRSAAERMIASESMAELCLAAHRAVGGLATGIVQQTEPDKEWILSYQVDPFPQVSLNGVSVIARALTEGVKGFLRTSDNLRHADRNLLESVGADTLLVVPIATTGRAWGVLLVFLKYGSLFIDDDLSLLALLAQQSAIFLENSQLVERLRTYSEQLERRLQLTEALYETSRALLTAKGHEQILNAVFTYARQDNADVASFFSLELNSEGKPEWAVSTARAGAPVGVGSSVGARYHLPDIPVSNLWISAPNTALLISDVFVDERFDPAAREMARQAGYRAAAMVPLTFHGSWLGLLTITWAQPHPFDPSDEQSYSALAALVVTVLESERLGLAEQQALEKLAQQEARYRILAENISDMITCHAPDGTITYVSASSLSLLGYAPGDLIGHTLEHWIHPEDVAVVHNTFSGESPPSEATVYRMRHRAGHFLWVETMSRAMRDESGSPEIVGTTRDISRRKQAEEAVYRLNRESEDRARQLATANRELEAFSYSVSHDLRAPLRALSGFSQALEEDYAERLDDEGRDYLRRIRAASQRMAGLIDDLLQLSRLTRTEMRRSEVNLSELACQIGAELQERYAERSVAFRVEEGLIVNGDARLLQAMLTNLLDNAWKFTSKTPDPQVEFAAAAQNGRRVYFVRDNGAGFDMAYANKLFGVFQRLHTVSEFDGTGVGLATVQRIVHRHDGEIWAEAAVNKGATFYFTLESNRTE
jgi:PAS domain S-box-containing protein